jgi:hypothetical protein
MVRSSGSVAIFFDGLDHERITLIGPNPAPTFNTHLAWLGRLH